MHIVGFVFDVPANCPNSRGLVPFVCGRKQIHYIEGDDYMPNWYVYDKKLWQLVTGGGSTYYIPSRTYQVLPLVDDGPWLSCPQDDLVITIRPPRQKLIPF